MMQWIKQFVLALAIVVMPIQGIAAGLASVICHGESDLQATATHDHESHSHSGHENGNHDDGAATGDTPSHLCCHHTVSGIPTMIVSGITPEFQVLATAPALLHDLFLPDRPQRPPLA
jgi:hypothetical protein